MSAALSPFSLQEGGLKKRKVKRRTMTKRKNKTNTKKAVKKK